MVDISRTHIYTIPDICYVLDKILDEKAPKENSIRSHVKTNNLRIYFQFVMVKE